MPLTLKELNATRTLEFKRADPKAILAKLTVPEAIEADALEAAAQINADRNLTRQGRGAALSALAEKSRADLVAWLRPLVDGLGRNVEALRARQQTAAARKGLDPAAAMVAELRAREIRDLARALPESGRLAMWARGDAETRTALIAAPDALIAAEMIAAERNERLAKADPEAAVLVLDAEEIGQVYRQAAGFASKTVETATGVQQPGEIIVL